SLTSAAQLVQKVRFAREALVLAAFGQVLVDTALRLLLVVVLLVAFGVRVPLSAAWLPVILMPLSLLTLGVGAVLAVLNAVVRDVTAALTVALQLGMLLTPVVYPRPESWPWAALNYVNPVSGFVVASHDVVGRGALTLPTALATSSLCSVLALMVGWRIFRLAQPFLAERI